MNSLQYKKWIKSNIDYHYGRCAEITQQMADAFPELQRIRGHYYCTTWGEREHWWLKTDTGEIVDPTESQFPSKGCGVYVEWVGEEPTGMCPECGEYCFDNEYFCSENCSVSCRAYINGGL